MTSARAYRKRVWRGCDGRSWLWPLLEHCEPCSELLPYTNAAGRNSIGLAFPVLPLVYGTSPELPVSNPPPGHRPLPPLPPLRRDLDGPGDTWRELAGDRCLLRRSRLLCRLLR